MSKTSPPVDTTTRIPDNAAVMSIEHDPRLFGTSLRDHLASHDTKLVVLCGAGTSAAVSKTGGGPLVPTIADLTQRCERSIRALGVEFGAAWDALIAECDARLVPKNIENILSRVRLKLEAMGPSDTTVGLDSTKLAVFDEQLRTTIVAETNPPDADIPTPLPHDDVARWLRGGAFHHPVEIFTTNYDVLLERSFETSRVRVQDGFTGSHLPYFCAETVEDDSLLATKGWVRLWKIHGSVNWTEVTIGSERRVVRDRNARPGDVVILPSHRKYDQSRKEPYQALIDRLRRKLLEPHTLLLTCGFSFSDQHLNEVVFSALAQQPQSHAICLMYGPLSGYPSLAAKAATLPNLAVAAKDKAVISGREGAWTLTGPIDPGARSFMDSFFDGHPVTSSAWTGDVNLGDFARLASFLKTFEREWRRLP